MIESSMKEEKNMVKDVRNPFRLEKLKKKTIDTIIQEKKSFWTRKRK